MAQHTHDIQTLGEQQHLKEEGDEHPTSAHSYNICEKSCSTCEMFDKFEGISSMPTSI